MDTPASSRFQAAPRPSNITRHTPSPLWLAVLTENERHPPCLVSFPKKKKDERKISKLKRGKDWQLVTQCQVQAQKDPQKQAGFRAASIASSQPPKPPLRTRENEQEERPQMPSSPTQSSPTHSQRSFSAREIMFQKHPPILFLDPVISILPTSQRGKGVTTAVVSGFFFFCE